MAWKDNALVLFLSTAYEVSENEYLERRRKRPTTNTTRGTTKQADFRLWPD